MPTPSAPFGVEIRPYLSLNPSHTPQSHPLSGASYPIMPGLAANGACPIIATWVSHASPPGASSSMWSASYEAPTGGWGWDHH